MKRDGQLERLHVVHRRPGHPSNETLALVRMLQLGGATEDIIDMARHLECRTCKLGQRPKRPFAARADARAVAFGLLYMDLKYVNDFKGDVYVVVSMVDEHVAWKFLSGWIALHGAPRLIVLNQGGEFESDFVATLEQSFPRSLGATAPSSMVMRSGMVRCWEAIIAEQCTRRLQMKTSLACALQAKNRVVSRAGHP